MWYNMCIVTKNIFNPSMRINPLFAGAAGLVEKMVSNYDIRQSDPIAAAENGVGNCISKAVLGGILLERAMVLGPKAVLAWNSHTHPKIGDDLFGRTRILNRHAQLLAATRIAPYTITALSFNPDGVSSANWQVFDFNDDGERYAVVKDNQISASDKGLAVGFIIADWYAGGRMYHDALGQHDSTFHTFTEEEMTEQVVGALKERDLLLSIQ